MMKSTLKIKKAQSPAPQSPVKKAKMVQNSDNIDIEPAEVSTKKYQPKVKLAECHAGSKRI